jgi:hydroxyacylglutathione hydrolase
MLNLFSLVIFMFTITPIAAFQDNYIWALCQPDNQLCVVVDPGDAKPVQEFLQQHNKQLTAILITHHHHDHIGGLTALCQDWPDVRVIGPAAEQHKIGLLTEVVRHNDTVSIENMQLNFSVISVPGHTLGHIAFYSAPVLFCGDTLFSAGCGRLFEGSPEQMLHSLSLLAALPDNTQVYCTHEYTLSNLAFAAYAEPDNIAITDYSAKCTALRQRQQPTLPSTLAIEKQVNPFLRCENKILQQIWQANSALDLFTKIRAAKDKF